MKDLHEIRIRAAKPAGDGHNISTTNHLRYPRILKLLPSEHGKLRGAALLNRIRIVDGGAEPVRLDGKIDGAPEDESRKRALERKRQTLASLREYLDPPDERGDSEPGEDTNAELSEMVPLDGSAKVVAERQHVDETIHRLAVAPKRKQPEYDSRDGEKDSGMVVRWYGGMVVGRYGG